MYYQNIMRAVSSNSFGIIQGFINLPYLIRRKSTPWIFNQDSQHPNICWIPDMSSYDSSLHPRYDSNNVTAYMHAKEIEMCNDTWLWLHKTFNAITITDDDDLIVMCVSLSRTELNKSFWYCMHCPMTDIYYKNCIHFMDLIDTEDFCNQNQFSLTFQIVLS